MLHSTKGIVFHTLKYSESSIIVKIYTELFGIQSYLFRGVRGRGAKVKPGLFQPLTLLELVVYHKEQRTLHSVKEVCLGHPYQNIPSDIRKSSVLLFINELAYKSIREEEANPPLFEFLWASCLHLDETRDPVTNFPLLFALHLCHYLGIFPQTNHSSQFPVFNLREGLFQPSIPDHPHYLDPDHSSIFYSMLTTPFLRPDDRINPALEPLPAGINSIGPATRKRLLDTLLLYYQLHLTGFKGLHSHHILHDVLS
jgi:DNA repair protein RecO (recombination protein O)